VFNLFSASAIQLSKTMASRGPAESEGNLATSPGSQGANREATPVLPCAASTSSHPRSEGVPLAQGNELPSQGYGTSAQGHGTPVARVKAAPPPRVMGSPTAAWGMAAPPPRVMGVSVKTVLAVKTLKAKRNNHSIKLAMY